MAATQDALYADLDLDLSWSERELPERERTKHVHRLHPYHGKLPLAAAGVRARRRAARRALACRAFGRRTTHFDLEVPREPRLDPYWFHKHRRECRPVEGAQRFLTRYVLDTLARLKELARSRS